MSHSENFIPYTAQRLSLEESKKRSVDFRAYMDQRKVTMVVCQRNG